MVYATSPPPAFNSSPTTSSPLSQPPVYPKSTLFAGQEVEVDPRPIPVSRRRPSTTPSRHSISPITVPYQPPRSPTSIPSLSPTVSHNVGDSPSPLSRSRPLLGSYTLSLLHARMSGHRPHVPTPGFSLHLGALGKGKSCPRELRCPSHLVVPFEALYYDLSDDAGGNASSNTPWVGAVDIHEWMYNCSLPSRPLNASRLSSDHPTFPGYRVASRGQLQILIKMPEPSPSIKVFLIPYDLRRIPPGGRLMIRENSYVRHETKKEREGEVLRHAVQLQFICLPEDKTSLDPKRLYYVTKSIRVIFTAFLPEKDEVIRTERSEQVIEPAVDISGIEEWEAIKRDWNSHLTLSGQKRAETRREIGFNEQRLRQRTGQKCHMPVATQQTDLLPIQSTLSLSRSRPGTPSPASRAVSQSLHAAVSPGPPGAPRVWSPGGRGRTREDELEEKELSERLARQLKVERG